MGKVLTSVMLIGFLAAGGLIALMVQDRSNLHRRLVESDAKQRQLEAELLALRAERDRLRSQSSQSAAAAAKSPSGTASTASAGATTAKGTAGDAAIPGRKMWAEMMKAPGMKEVMKQQRLAMLDMQYAKLYGTFGFSDEEKTFFKNLLGDRLGLEAELGIKLVGDDLTTEQRSAIMKEYQDAKKTSDASIRDFLNSEDDYKSFQRWEDTKAERMQVEMGRSLFSSAGEDLSPDQEQQLIDTMYQVRSTPDGSVDFSKPENFDPAKMNDEEIGRQLSRVDKHAQQVYDDAAKFLSPAQLGALRSMQQQWRTMTESGLKMAMMMLKNQQGK
jgi:hypothetical protein